MRFKSINCAFTKLMRRNVACDFNYLNRQGRISSYMLYLYVFNGLYENRCSVWFAVDVYYTCCSALIIQCVLHILDV